MNTTRKIEQDSDGVLVVALTPEEQAKWDDLNARLEKIEIALADAKRIARRERSRVVFYLKYRKSIFTQLSPLHQIRFPEYHFKQSSPIS